MFCDTGYPAEKQIFIFVAVRAFRKKDQGDVF